MADIAKGHPLHSFKGIKIRKIGNPWQADHRQIDLSDLLLSVKALGQTVFIFYFNIQIRSHSYHRNTAFFFQHGDTRI